MSETNERSVTPQEIMDFLYEIMGEKTKIEPAWSTPDFQNRSGFQVETCIGSSFTFEIIANTQEKVAWKYFNHCCEVYGYYVKKSKSFLWRFVNKFSNKERKDFIRKLERLHAWRDAHN